MISFMAEVIGIRDDMYIGKGNAYMREVSRAVQDGYGAGIREQRPTLVNLQCDIDHPTQSMTDAMSSWKRPTAATLFTCTVCRPTSPV
jgi:ornithine carbamoyltransferase